MGYCENIFPTLRHGTIIGTGITCKKISCYLHDSVCRWLVPKNAKILHSYVKYFHIFHVEKIVESWLVYRNNFSWIIMFRDRDNNSKLVPVSFLELLWGKNIFYPKKDEISDTNNRYNLSAL